MSSALNRTSANQILLFFDACFKQGVLDAYDLGSDLEARDFLQEKRADWSFGRLGMRGEFDWQMFRQTLYWWARRSRLQSLAEKYIFKIRTKAITWCLFPFCMRFYLNGIEEWIDYPNEARIEIFKSSKRVHWSPNSELSKFTKGDYFSYLHEFAYQFRQIPESEQPVNATLMDSFIQALYDLSSAY